jgi:pantoate--beta-alanine ligase
MHTTTTLDALQEALAPAHAAGARVALVPTMGALHAGHMALVRHARTLADIVVVSIFVNPTQFGPNEDFSRYPRTEAADSALLHAEGVDILWLPSVETMYPVGSSTRLHVAGVSEGLCGAFRPGHFDGVATVVHKLLMQVMPNLAVFGEKDYQQLCVIRRMVEDLHLPVDMVGLPTVREADGLALSSRNRYLSSVERAIAPVLHSQLTLAATALAAGAPVHEVLRTARDYLLMNGFSKCDYLELCAADTLTPQLEYKAGARLLAAVHLGSTRLIDNIEV